MTSKSIFLTEEAYELLKKMRRGDESFSAIIIRLARRSRLSDCAGLWSDIPEDGMAVISDSILELRKRTRASTLSTP